MVVSDGIVHANAVLMIDAVAAVACLVFVSNALVAQRMVGFVLHLSVICPIGERVGDIHAKLVMIVDEAATYFSHSIFVLAPCALQLS